MTFCRRAKEEIAETEYGECCNAAHLYGILSFAKEFSRDAVVIQSVSSVVIEHVLSCFRRFGVRTDALEVSRGKQTFSLRLGGRAEADRILSDFGYSGDEPSYRILSQNFLCDNCRAAFLAGCFLTGGTVTEPKKGYHLEFITHKSLFFLDFVEVLRSALLHPKISARRGNYKIAYFKDSTEIEDFLTRTGAPNASMEMMNEKIVKDVINRVNRRINCENANIDKTVRSSADDRSAISYILREKGADYLPGDLREIALLRVRYPELSLADLGTMTEADLSKSGVNHRLRRIREAAARLKEQHDANQ